jgi:RNA-binding protein Luc7-like 2
MCPQNWTVRNSDKFIG